MPPPCGNGIDGAGSSLSRRRWLKLGSALALPLPIALPTWADSGAAKVALVIGNAAYETAPLRNPVRDAAAMSALLAGLGFQVVEERDADRLRMDAAVERAAAALRGRPQGIALLYYAGHGVQIDWRNYLLPVDVRADSNADITRQCVDVQRVLGAFRAAGARMNILVLDACRDSPFGAGGLRGLAPMDAPPGTFFAYATAPGNVADDGGSAEGHGPYTRFLLQELPRPDARLEDIFKRVRLQVRQATQGRQVPWESTSLEEDFVFVSGERAPATGAREREFEAERGEWERIRSSTRAEDYYAFLQRHPRGPFAELAQFSLDRLVRPALVEQAPQALQQVTVLPPGADRYKVGDQWDTRLVDHLARSAVQDRRARVTAIEGPRVIVNGGQLVLDQMGSTIVNDTGRKDPGVLFVPAQLQVGKRWRADFDNHPPGGGPPSRSYYDLHVAALDDIEVPAGRFRAFRIEGRGEALRANGGARLETTYWIDPQTMWGVRTVLRLTDQRRDWPERYTTSELVRIRRAPR